MRLMPRTAALTFSQEKKSSAFTHRFSGYSIWIEPCTHDAKHILEEMKGLETLCSKDSSGRDNGVHSFMPHCTVLYNFDPKDLELGDSIVNEIVKHDHNDDDADDGASCESGCNSIEDIGRKMLLECLDLYRANDQIRKQSSIVDENCELELIPTDFYFFPYPKEADGGKGFGCVIPLLMLKNTPQLATLHSAVKHVFPSDERHSGEGSTFVPHMALCYAPESYEDELRRYTEEVLKVDEEKKVLLRKMKGSYLSLWNTQGQLKDWRCIVKVLI